MQITAVIPRPHIARLRAEVVKAAVKRAALPFILSRAGLLIVTMIASGGVPNIWRWWFWDGGFYAGIASVGYTQPGWYAWFPLLPVIEHGIHLTTGLHEFYAGLIVANLACFAACTALEVFAPVRPHALPVSALLLASPFAFFLAAPYTESLFLLLAVGAFLALKRNAFGWAVGCAALASSAHPTGVVLAVPILLEWLRQRGALLKVAPIALASISGLLAYMAFCLLSTGNALTFYRAERVYQGRALTWPWVTLEAVGRAASHPSLQFIANGAAIGIALVTLAVCARHIPVGQLLYTVGVMAPVLLTPILTGPDPLVAGGRYMLAAFPVFLLLHRASQKHPRTALVLLAASVAAQAILTLFELQHGWLP